jgi:predicted small integral membrane protein
MNDVDLRQIERSTYRATMDSGLWDFFLGSIVAMFSIAPLLSVHLGDFWSSAVFFPVFVAELIAIRVVEKRVVEPRVGFVEFARPRRQRMLVFGVMMLVVNVVALVAGVVAATRLPVMNGPIVSFTLSMVILVGFTLASFFLEIPRVFFYGLLLAAAPLVGEALFIRGYASHHGFPIVFGVCTVVILVSGIVRFMRFLPRPQAANVQPTVDIVDD